MKELIDYVSWEDELSFFEYELLNNIFIIINPQKDHKSFYLTINILFLDKIYLQGGGFYSEYPH